MIVTVIFPYTYLIKPVLKAIDCYFYFCISIGRTLRKRLSDVNLTPDRQFQHGI